MNSLFPQAFAATDLTPVNTALKPIFANIINPILLFMFALATLVFVYGVIQVILNPTDSDKHSQGRWSMLWGTVGFFIMLSAWGIIHIVANTVATFR